MFRSSIRQRKYDYLTRRGFFPSEAQELSRTSRKGISAPYFQRMIRSRSRTIQNLKDAGRTEKGIRNFIKQQYIDNGWLKQDKIGRTRIDVWKLLRSHEDKSKQRGEEYESPWRTRTYKRRATKRERKSVTRKDMLKSLISKLEGRIKRTSNQNKRTQLEEQLFSYQQQLRKMDK